MRRLLAGIPRSIDGSNDPVLDQEGLVFWRGALDPTRLSKWRILSASTNILAFEFAVSMATNGPWPLIDYFAFGAPFLLGWMALAFNDAQKLRKALRIDRKTVVDGFLARDFRKPRNLLRRIAILLIPGLMRRMRRVAAEASIVVDPSRDPTFDNDSLRFWRNALDPARVSMWRLVSFGGNIALIVLLIGALSQDASATSGFAMFGLMLFVIWTLYAFIGAHEFRKAISKRSKPGNDGGFGLRGTGTISWRWLIWPAILAANVLSHWLTQN